MKCKNCMGKNLALSEQELPVGGVGHGLDFTRNTDGSTLGLNGFSVAIGKESPRLVRVALRCLDCKQRCLIEFSSVRVTRWDVSE